MDDIEKFPERKEENEDDTRSVMEGGLFDRLGGGNNELGEDEGGEDNYDWDDTTDVDLDLVEFLKEKPTLIQKFDAFLGDIGSEKEKEKKEEKFRSYRRIFINEIERMKLNDKLNEDAWNKELNLEERERLLWEQKVRIFNEALEEHGITLDSNNFELYNFVRENIEETLTEKRKIINGFKYDNEKIIKRNREGKFETIDGKKLHDFLTELQKFTTTSARSELIDILGDDENIEITARECLNEIRDQEIASISRTREWVEMRDLRPDLIDMEGVIDNLKNNKRVDLSKSIIRKTLEGKLNSMKEWAKENKTTLGVGATSFLISLISGLSSTIPIIDKMKEAGKSLKKVGNVLENAGKKLKKLGNKIDNIFSDPVKALGASVSFFGRFLQDFPELPFILVLIIIVGIIFFIINKWKGGF